MLLLCVHVMLAVVDTDRNQPTNVALLPWLTPVTAVIMDARSA